MANKNLEKLKLYLIEKINNEKNENKLIEIKRNFRSKEEIIDNPLKRNKEYAMEQNKINKIKKLSINQIKNLKESNIKKLSLFEWLSMSQDQFKELNKDLIQYVPYEVFRFNKNNFFLTLNKEKLLSLSTETITEIFNSLEIYNKRQINNFFTDEQAYYLLNYDHGSKLIYINNNLIRSFIISKAENFLKNKNKLKTLKISEMTANQFKNIPKNMLNN